MTDQRQADDSMEPTAADLVSDPSMVPMDDDAGGPTADKDDQMPADEPDEGEVAATLGDFA